MNMQLNIVIIFVLIFHSLVSFVYCLLGLFSYLFIYSLIDFLVYSIYHFLLLFIVSSDCGVGNGELDAPLIVGLTTVPKVLLKERSTLLGAF